MLDWLRDDDDGEEPTSGDSPGEDLLGDADWEEDDMGDMGDMGDDLGFDDMAGGGDQAVDELANRVDGFEEEIGKMSSTVNTIKHENAEMGEDLDEVKDNVRKLLEIYEMVTRGVNPFVDDDPFAGGQESSFDLFGDDGGDDDAEDGAFDDADAFVDDDFDDMDEFEFDEEEEEDPFEADEAFEEDPDGANDEDGGGRSFDELKEEYESGEAEWDDADETEDDFVDEEPPEDDPFDDNDIEESETEPVEDSSPPSSDHPGYDAPEGLDGSMGILGEKPYLAQLPDGYAVDIVVMEWLAELDAYLEEGSAGDIVEYYRVIGWISNEVADELQAFAPGLSDGAAEPPTLGAALPVEAHKTSLQYIHELATTTSRRVVVSDSISERGDLATMQTPELDDLTRRAMEARTDGGSFWAAIEGFDSSGQSNEPSGDAT